MKTTTKQEIEAYLNETHTHTLYTASVYFGIEIEEVYRILECK